MLSKELTLINPLGLHARAASKLVDVAKHYAADVHIEYQGRRVDGKSIMALLMLGAAVGSSMTIITEGEDEEAALNGVTELVEAGFYELDEA